MPVIKNKTKQVLCLTGRGGECVKIEPDQRVEVSADVWANNERQECVQALLDDRKVLVIHSSSEAPRAAAPKAKPKADASADSDDSDDWSSVHWRKAQKLINEATETDDLYRLLEGEDRPKIKSMLEARIGELEAA